MKATQHHVAQIKQLYSKQYFKHTFLDTKGRQIHLVFQTMFEMNTQHQRRILNRANQVFRADNFAQENVK